MTASASIERLLEPAGFVGNGVFVAVVGPSGAGKDTILDYARVALKDQAGFHFVRRVVTRPSSVDAEDHDTLSREEFAIALQSGAFAHQWQAHGLCYGLPVSIHDEIRRGAVAIANVSRGIIPALRATYGQFVVVHITASHEVLAQRLAARGRESAKEIEYRLLRAGTNPCDPSDAIMIDNSGHMSRAGDEFVTLLKKIAMKAAISEQI
ncbi:phosphonate metabolism protein/1,5-bisphosphokinase (PRPP-forming) PhnN [Phyllobacterium sp. YR531]|uniref:phosphonate metabolism protein/1,5-bisphosphokinase (PRPP-forming) PhnN n=1 Tax=Phyllobacterium sp. YR531 TaxID=1144343 RepID=UPI00026F6C87|nr:phosphonate metabolism protein/1,5-bisphosphokinase (PRPP-forming) PhnN [Phyllobacterium sp. YR531]EJN03909.1 phosphonate metabolism protein, PRPP-forming 1,5-bisphosphokinase PhnN [Phyllobacterium sp. YR531]